ncbi:MAG: hypothetical protein UT29_C0002G0025 [Candidatus Yanofskybacteria bacterium GW2011_GWA1_39_13]|uniref:Peptidase C39-like domain-containing protein n=1 Tax=Yanofskybacteria sp. (strain GW2011_GWA1_39_13) TaxID=1619019 RepID=A0A0G0MH03_YANXG|nr:MAG: hypothetical protein UT29_C0002G0025 [Candidatus Yanofskybacteria bacterium GW2011_GWA1_39_13]
MTKKTLIISLVILAGGLTAVLVFKKVDFLSRVFETPLPSAIPYNGTPVATPINTSIPKPVVSTAVLASGINLKVPFTSQAPSKNWGLPFSEFCEEASALMVASYINGWTIPTIEFAEQKMLEIKAFEDKRFGYYKDTTAEETAVILREFYKLDKVKVVYEPTVQIMKKALSENKAILIPVAGRMLGNPYFQSPGPIYHMLVIKGYTKDGDFITNDPGTRNGENYIYSPEVIMNALHDWNSVDMNKGAKVIVIVG